MIRAALAVALVVLASALVHDPASAAVTEEGAATLDPFGKVELYRDHPTPTRVVLLLSDADGWNRPDVERARALATLDALVVGIDVRRYLATMAERGGDELYLFADLEVLSQFVQKRMRLPSYVPPVVVGRGAGATLAYAVSASTRPNDFAGTVSLGFCPTVVLPKPLGRGSGLDSDAVTPAGTHRLRPARTLVAPWTVIPGECDPSEARRFADGVANATVLPLAPPGDFDDPEAWLPQLRHVLERTSARPTPATTNGAAPVADLPLIEVPARGTPRALAVILSGDGGWASLDREVGDALAAAGVGVVGLNSLSYFWTKRTPDGTAADVVRVIRHYADAWRAPRVLLVGYSRGADVLPFVASRLPPGLASSVAVVALLGPGRTTDFEFHLTDWLGGDDPAAAAVAPEVAKLRGLRVLCVQGSDEGDSLCPTLNDGLARRMVLPGGHHFGGDYAPITARILAEAGLADQPPNGAP